MNNVSSLSHNLKRSRLFITLIGMLFTTKVLSVSPFSQKFPLGNDDNRSAEDTSERSFAVGQFQKHKANDLPVVKRVYREDDATKVIILLPNKKILLETELQTYRDFVNYGTRSSARARSGKLRVESKINNLIVAQVLEDGTEELATVDPQYNAIMVGDVVKSIKKVVRQKVQLIRDISLVYRELFKDPSRYPETYELSVQGKKLLKESLKKYGKLRIETLFIQSFVDNVGSELENQIESKQRAEVVKSFLVSEMNYDDQKLVPIAMGELEPEFGNEVPGSSARNRRITFKIAR